MQMTLTSLFGSEDSNCSQAVEQLFDLAAAKGSQKNHPVMEVVLDSISPTFVLMDDGRSDGTATPQHLILILK